MSLSKFAALFLCIVMCMFYVTNRDIDDYKEITNERVTLDDTLDRALDAAVDGIVMSVDGYDVKVSREKAAENFYRTLQAGMCMLDDSDVEKSLIELYVPMLALADTDGISVQYTKIINGDLVKVWSAPKSYVKSYSMPYGSMPNQTLDYSMVYTLSDDIVIVLADKQYSGTWQELSELYKNTTDSGLNDIKTIMSSNIFESEDTFDLERDSAVSEVVAQTIARYVNQHNEIARQYGERYTFYLPETDESDISRNIDNQTFLCLFQGYPLGQGGSETYSRFAFAGTRVAKNNSYYVSSSNGYLYYHKAWCEDAKNSTAKYDTKYDCAMHGALPCDKCRP